MMAGTKGKFITFEGGEGSGKSTQLRLLSDYLTKMGIGNVQTKEPGGTDVGLELRRVLVTGDKDKMDAVAEALLYYADRRIHLTQKIWPALARGEWVLSDRFADSTVAYQYYGYEHKIDRRLLDDLYAVAVGDFKPDLTILLDLPPEIGLKRSLKKASGMSVKELRHESRGLVFHDNLRKGYLKMAKAEPERFVVLNADKNMAELNEEIIKVVTERFGL